jgi:hypothetical protein
VLAATKALRKRSRGLPGRRHGIGHVEEPSGRLAHIQCLATVGNGTLSG